MPRSITVPAGTSRALDFAVTYPSTWSVALKRGTSVLAADIASARFLLKDEITADDASALVTKTIGSGIAKADGLLTVTLNPADTKELEGSYVGTLRIYLVSGEVVDFEDASYPDVYYIQLSFTQGAVEAIS